MKISVNPTHQNENIIDVNPIVVLTKQASREQNRQPQNNPATKIGHPSQRRR
jgi:hypothetical protein